MNSQEAAIIEGQPRTYQEWIDQGDALMNEDVKEAQICFQKALELADDKYESHLRLGSMQFGYDIAQNNLVSALEYANNQKDRLLTIANELEVFYFQYGCCLALYVYGLIKMIDPNYDHELLHLECDQERLARQFIEIGKANYAIGPIEKLIEFSENQSDTLITIGTLIVENGLVFQSAEQYFQRALNKADDKFDLLLQIGDIYFSKYPDLSIKYYEYAIQQRPESLQPHLRIFKQKLQLQLFQEVLQQVKKIQIPDDFQSYLDLGVLLVSKDETYNDGLEFILKGLELSQNKFQTIQNLLDLNELKCHKVSKVLCEKAFDININDLDIWKQYAYYLLYWDKISDETPDVFDKGLIANPDLEMLYLYKAQLLEKLGRNDEAINNYKKGIQKSPDVQCLWKLIQLLFQNKQLDEGLQYYFRLDQNDGGQLYYLSEVLFQYGYYDECIKTCDKSIQSENNKFPDYVIVKKAEALFELKRYEEAIPILEIAINYDGGRGDRAEDIYKQIQKIKEGQQDKNQKVEEQ